MFLQDVGDGLTNVTRMLYAGVLDTAGGERALRALAGPLVIAATLALYLLFVAVVLYWAMHFVNAMLGNAGETARRLLVAVLVALCVAMVYRHAWHEDWGSPLKSATAAYQNLATTVRLAHDLAPTLTPPPPPTETPPPATDSPAWPWW